MSRQFSTSCVVLTLVPALLVGCMPQQPIFLFEDGDLSHYIGKATEIEFPDVEMASLDEVNGARPPLTVDNPDPDQFWELPLEEAVQVALANSKVIRQRMVRGSQVGPRILSTPGAAPTNYDPALAESGDGITGPLGVEAALADFDAVLDGYVHWRRNDQQANVGNFGQQIFSTVREEEIGSFQTQLRKTAATGATFYMRHNVDYLGSNSPIRGEPSDWDARVEAEFSQPLLQGNGVQFNRIFGPRTTSVSNSAGASAYRSQGGFRGVMIARINTDISLVDFESQVRNLVSDVEVAYWDLYRAYRELDALRKGRNQALETWRNVKADHDAGRGATQDEAQSRYQYWEFEALLESAQGNVYQLEADLRYLLGLAATDGRLIRPSDEPTTAELRFDFCDIQAEALARTVELRRQKWVIKGQELKLIATKNLLLPELNVGGVYRWRGLGDQLIDPNNRRNNAYGNMTGGDFQEWFLGVNFMVPIGFRREMTRVRNAQLELAKQRAILQDQELAISHELSTALRNLALNYALAEKRLDQRRAAETELEAYEDMKGAGLPVREKSLDRQLDAQRRLVEAESKYYSALVEYNKAIAQVHFRKGSLLEYNGVHLAEGMWPAKAYFDALWQARARDAGTYLNYGFTRPKVVSRGPIDQHAGGTMGFDGEMIYEEGSYPEVLETPLPTPVPNENGPGPIDDTLELPDASSVLEPARQPRIIVPGVGARPATNASGHNLKTSKAKRYDLASLDLKALTGTTSPAKAPRAASPVQQVGYHQVVGDRNEPHHATASQYQSTQSAKAAVGREPLANSSPASVDRNAPRWKRVQR